MKLMTHIIAGYPSLKESEEIALNMAKNGANYIEIQIPFTDPIADGPIIFNANMESLKNGTTIKDCFNLLHRITSKTNVPILFMTYFNIIHAYGVEEFCKKAKQFGCYGLIVPDITFDVINDDNFKKSCKLNNLKIIQIISPITPIKRLKLIAKVADGFVYCVSHFGTTGESIKTNLNIKNYLTKIRKYIKTPLALGFGISTPKHAKQAAKYADIVVIGSKFLSIINQNKKNYQHKVSSFLKLL